MTNFLHDVLARREQQTAEALRLFADTPKETAIYRVLMHMSTEQVDALLAALKETQDG